MSSLPQSLEYWNTPSFKQVFKAETLSLGLDFLTPYLATSQGGYISPNQLDLGILSALEDEKKLTIKAGFFFTEVVGGCNCDDDPFEVNNHCILLINIDKSDSSCHFELVPDE